MIKLNRGQISIFVIIGITIIAFIFIFLLFKINVLDIGNTVPPEVKPINDFVENCIKKSADDAVYYIGDSGGYYIVPKLATENKVAYYFYNKQNYMPSKEIVKNELSEFMNDAIFLCTKNFVDFPDYEVKSSGTNTSVEFMNDSVYFKIKYPLSIKKADKTYVIKDFETSVKIRLGIIYDSIKKIMDMQMKSSDVCLDCIADTAIENNLYINMMDYHGDVIFGVYDLENDLNGEEYVFYFANQYD